MLHELKTDPDVYRSMVSGTKTFDVRRNDRNFQPGDTVLLRELECKADEKTKTPAYTGNKAKFQITYVLTGSYGIPDDYAVLSLHPVDDDLRLIPLKTIPDPNLESTGAEIPTEPTMVRTVARDVRFEHVVGIHPCPVCGGSVHQLHMVSPDPTVLSFYPISCIQCHTLFKQFPLTVEKFNRTDQGLHGLLEVWNKLPVAAQKLLKELQGCNTTMPGLSTIVPGVVPISELVDEMDPSILLQMMQDGLIITIILGDASGYVSTPYGEQLAVVGTEKSKDLNYIEMWSKLPPTSQGFLKALQSVPRTRALYLSSSVVQDMCENHMGELVDMQRDRLVTQATPVGDMDSYVLSTLGIQVVLTGLKMEKDQTVGPA